MNNFSSNALDIAPMALYVYPQGVMALEGQHALSIQPRNQAYGSQHRKMRPSSPITAWRRGFLCGEDAMNNITPLKGHGSVSLCSINTEGRECSVCHKFMPWSMFYRSRVGPMGYCSLCKECSSLRCKKAHFHMGEPYRERRKQYMRQYYSNPVNKEHYQAYWSQPENRKRANDNRRKRSEVLKNDRDWIVKRQKRSSNYYLNNINKIKQHARVYREKNREKIDARAAKWREQHPERAKELARIQNMRRYARKKNLAGWGYTKDYHIKWRIDLFGGICYVCRKTYSAIDHVIAVSGKGTHYPSNLRPICQPCNSSKGNKPLYPWIIKRRHDLGIMDVKVIP